VAEQVANSAVLPVIGYTGPSEDLETAENNTVAEGMRPDMADNYSSNKADMDSYGFSSLISSSMS
jgi:hypothetical protein